MYVNLSTGVIVGLGDIKSANPHKSIPESLTDSQANQLGFANLYQDDKPNGDVVTLKDIEKISNAGEDAVYKRGWDVRGFTQGEEDANFLKAKEKVLDTINNKYDIDLGYLVSSYPKLERESWTQQNIEARAYLAWAKEHKDVVVEEGDPVVEVVEKPDTKVLDEILLGRNEGDGQESLEELCNKVITKSDLFASAQRLTGKRQRLEKIVESAKTQEELDKVSW